MNEEYLVNHNEEIKDEFVFEFVEFVVQHLEKINIEYISECFSLLT
jgi:hypothetical protein